MILDQLKEMGDELLRGVELIKTENTQDTHHKTKTSRGNERYAEGTSARVQTTEATEGVTRIGRAT